MPPASTRRWCFEPVRERSTGDGPVRSPQKGAHMRAADGGARPVDRASRVELLQQTLMQRVPHAGGLPVTQPPPRGHARAVGVLLGQVLPRDPRVQDVQDPVEHQPVGERLAPRVAATTLTDRDQRLHLGPQLIINLEPRRHLHDLPLSTTTPTDFEIKATNPLCERPSKSWVAPEVPTGKINVTDPDSRNVKAPRGYLQGYNAQAVCNEQQIVIAAEISGDSPDFGHLGPMITAA
ncbi:MAG: hypothetical protein QOJ29_5471 [Thermoleophilaceae bacterium]|nr:hypothetical protein [Thermoleophilaceae bacterium]